ncbi:solute carrier family 4 member 11-like [Oppia nitens]|uniref:solute carrier family 4 member 11-like n=1 Tax=Oppia nitens TaxID=1686743 RepID=UPI0023DCB1C9|nr:solute carrier family 4 member 11-like [Oppia nitens]
MKLDLINAETVEEFIVSMKKRIQQLTTNKTCNSNLMAIQAIQHKYETTLSFSFGKGIAENFKRRSGYYWSDFTDAFVGEKSIHKTMATIASLYFAIILPCIAFGVRDHNNTNGNIDARRALIGQTIGGIVFALFSGQPLVVIMTTAPLCLLTKVVYDISEDLSVDFFDVFACVGLWNALFVIMYALFDVSYLMKWCTRSTEEIFGLFSFFAFFIDPIKDCIENFKKFYCFSTSGTACHDCAPQNSVLFLMLMLFTVWLALFIYDFNKTKYLNSHFREILSDYALPIAVLTTSFVGSYLFQEIKAEKFEIIDSFEFKIITFKSLTISSIFVSLVLGFALSLLFFMDQNISAALVNNPSNKLKKGEAYHWDLLVVGVLNIFLSLFGLPWMNGMLPHSPIHARSLADVHRLVDASGHVTEEVVRARETRVTELATHALIGVSLFLIPHPLDYIPIAVLNGLFLYCAIASLRGNSFVERMLLFITEQTSYPPNHYIRRCPQNVIHLFTAIQIIQSAVLCFFAFSVWPYVQMAYPVVIAILMPIRAKLIPLIIDEKYIKAIDGYH